MSKATQWNICLFYSVLSLSFYSLLRIFFSLLQITKVQRCSHSSNNSGFFYQNNWFVFPLLWATVVTMKRGDKKKLQFWFGSILKKFQHDKAGLLPLDCYYCRCAVAVNTEVILLRSQGFKDIFLQRMGWAWFCNRRFLSTLKEKIGYFINNSNKYKFKCIYLYSKSNL